MPMLTIAEPNSAERARRLTELKQEIERNLPGRVRRYSAGWDAESQRVIGLEAWGQRVLEDVWSDLEATTPVAESEAQVSWQQTERVALDDYIEDRARDFVGRDGILARLERVALSATQADAAWGVVLTGAAGAGKSAIFSELYRRLQRSGNFMLSHAAGACLSA